MPPEILVALLSASGHRARAAELCGMPLRTFARRLKGHENELSALARAHGWPTRTEAATAAAAARRPPATAEERERRDRRNARLSAARVTAKA